jgi:peptide/nickel transport system permease protein
MIARALRASVVLFLTVAFVFIVLRVSGDPAETMLGERSTPETLAAFRIAWGLDKSIPEQFLVYVENAFQGNFGVSAADGREVFTIIAERIPKTLALTVSAFILSVLVGIPVGIAAAVRRDSPVDKAVITAAVLGYSVPNFLLGLALIFVFAVWLRVLPSSGSSTWQHAILPVATFGLFNAAAVARFTRSTLIEVLEQPYIAAARADGIPKWEVILRHALPNAAIPTVTIVGFMIGSLIAGAVVVESVFAWPGSGKLLIDAIRMRDYPVVQSLVLLFAFMLAVVNLLVDLLCGLLDPRIRHE